MYKLVSVILLVVVLFATMSAVVYADQPVDKDPKPEGTQEPRGESPDPCTDSDSCGNGDHGKKNGIEHFNPQAWQGEPDPPATEPAPAATEPAPAATEPAPTEPAQEPTVQPTDAATPPASATPPAENSVPGSAMQDEDCYTNTVTIEVPVVVTNTETCDVCAELRAIRAQNEQIIANQGTIITLLNKIYNIVVALIS